jgi:ferritin-like metal-binding protein YciE
LTHSQVEEVEDTCSAEKQALRCKQKALTVASVPTLRESIKLHIEQAQVQIERVQQAMEQAGGEARPRRDDAP